MRNAETILGVICERGTKGLPLERVYRLLFSRELYLLAYGRLYRNDGALTRGATADTVDGMSLAKIDRLIHEVRDERHVDASSASQDSQIQREDTPTGHPNVDGQAASGGHPADSGGLLRAAILSRVPRFSARSRVPHSIAASLPYVEWHCMVHRG